MSVWHEHLGQPRRASPGDGLQGSFLGPREDESQIRVVLEREGAVFERLEDDVLLPRVAARLAQGAAVGWVSGRMEFGPRALGARSILGDPRQPKMQSVLNQKIKHRESFRPFAPAVLAEKAADCFELEVPSPYMLLVAPIKEALRLPEGSGAVGLERLQQVRSTLPAVTHVDFSARVQTVHAQTNPRFHALLSRFDEQTGCPVLVNTSFNVRGEPIVCTTEDAWRCFMRTELDCLVIEQYFLEKARQPAQPSQSPRGAIDALD